MTADEVQSTNHTNDSVTLSLLLTQRLSESAVTVNMTKFNTVPTNRSDDMGNIVTEMVTWGTSAVFGELDLTGRELADCMLMMHVCIKCTLNVLCQLRLHIPSTLLTNSITLCYQIVCSRHCMHEVFHFLTPTRPSSVTTW